MHVVRMETTHQNLNHHAASNIHCLIKAHLAPYDGLTLIPTHTWPCPLWCVAVMSCVCVCVNLTVGPVVQYAAAGQQCSHSSSRGLLLLKEYLCPPQGWNACPAPHLWETLSQKSTEPLSDGIPLECHIPVAFSHWFAQGGSGT